MTTLQRAPRTILICNIRLIGDVVLSTPLVALFRQLYPQAEIDFLVNRGTGEFMEKDPRIRRVLYSDKWQKGGKLGSVSYLWDIAGSYDLALCLNPSDRGTLATVLAGRQTRLGFYEDSKPLGRFWRKLLLSHALPFDEEQHLVARCGQIAAALGASPQPLEVKVCWDAADREKVVTTLRAGGVDHPYCVLHPFARWRYKYWDISRFAAVSDHLAQRYGLQPVWTSSPDAEERQLLQEAAGGCDVAPLLVPGSFTLNQMACLLDGARIYVGLDTAITHIAAATGVPTVALYGPTELWRWHPWNNAAMPDSRLPVGYRGTFRSGTVVALQAGCAHAPCIRPACYRDGVENPCMMELTAATVCSEIDAMLQLGAGDSEPDSRDGETYGG